MIAVIGTAGQLGSAIASQLGLKNTPCLPIDREALDLSWEEPELLSRLDRLIRARGERARALILCAAYTRVDQAESERALAFQINARAPGAIARYCAENEIPLVAFSTDYVYSGAGNEPWRETSQTGPLNAYGESKLVGEKEIMAAGGDHLIFRTEWLFSHRGRNFLSAMLKLGEERETISVVTDQWGSPTYAPHLAEGVLCGLDWALSFSRFPSGIYHLSSREFTSWHGFAQAIFAGARALNWKLRVQEVKAIPSAEYVTPAKRPLNSRLNQEKAGRVLGLTLPSWKVGLEDCLRELKRS